MDKSLPYLIWMLVRTRITAAILTALIPSAKPGEALLTVLVRRIAKSHRQARYTSTLHWGMVILCSREYNRNWPSLAILNLITCWVLHCNPCFRHAFWVKQQCSLCSGPLVLEDWEEIIGGSFQAHYILQYCRNHVRLLLSWVYYKHFHWQVSMFLISICFCGSFLYSFIRIMT